MLNNPINELKDTILFQYLNSLDQNLAAKCVHFVESISPMLDSIIDYFPYYIRHDSNHSYNVVKQMDRIMQPKCLIVGDELTLNKSEAFLLLCSAYGHDLGMAVLPGEEDKF